MTARPADTRKSHDGVVFVQSQSETEIFTLKGQRTTLTGVTQCESSGAGILPGSQQPSQSNLTKKLL